MAVIKIVESAFDPYKELMKFQQTLTPGRYGASCSFIGFMRDFNDNAEVESLFLEYYPTMTEKQLYKIADKTAQQLDVSALLIVHRVGHINIGEPIVLTAACAEHREPAFAACKQLIDTLKYEAPFWKKEQLRDNSERWVERNRSTLSKDE